MHSEPQQCAKRSSAGYPLSRSHRVHQRAADVFGTQQSIVEEAIVDGDATAEPGEETGRQDQFLGPTSKDQTPTKRREGAPFSQHLGSTVPSYNRTVYNFTLDRIRTMNPDIIRDFTVSGSADHDAVLSAQVFADLSKLTLDEVPLAPSNTPTPAHQREMLDQLNRPPEGGGGKRRCLTDSSSSPGRAGATAARDFAIVN